MCLTEMSEIEKVVCERVEKGGGYFVYEAHYCEFDDDGSYMDDWQIWYHDTFKAIPFSGRI